MTILIILLKGFILGLSIAAPVGPMCILCIKRTLDKGRMSGLFSGVGIAGADGFYGATAAFGLTVITNFMTGSAYILKFIGGAFLLYLGIKTIFRKAEEHRTKIDSKKTKGLLKDLLSTFFLTLTNPMTIFSFMAIFAGLGITSYKDNLMSAMMVLGVFLGSLTWWFFLISIVSAVGHRMTEKTMRKIDVISGLFILSFGIMSLVSLFF